MRSLISILFVCLCLTAQAARQKTHRKSDSPTHHITRSAAAQRILFKPYISWDAEKIYRMPVILMSFADLDFSCENPQQFYDRLFNESGYNLGQGPGCVADYFRDQSHGKFNVVFDVVGPFKLTSNQKSKSGNNFGTSQFRDAIKLADDQLNYADYDWDGDGKAQSVIIIYAGYGGNEEEDTADGCIWPNTDALYFSLDGVGIGGYSASPELWTENTSCGIGTICHEFCHVLGLPDLYPTSGSEFSVLDEWDLMDGGNYSDHGWCPPNLSIHEREYLGWGEPEDLTKAKVITDMPSFDSSGKAYRIVNEAYPDEYYLLENRQWEGWDFMLPNHGLLITHIDFDESYWTSNSVNSNSRHHRLEYFHADNFDYDFYDELIGDDSSYGSDGRNMRLQYTSYPYIDAEGVSHDSLTDTSVPAAILFHQRADGLLLMGKPVTAIHEEGGLLSFLYNDPPTGIASLTAETRPVAYYDLRGCMLPVPPARGFYIIRYNDGSIKKVIDSINEKIWNEK
jgi:M6 family metalloprotease-like protein